MTSELNNTKVEVKVEKMETKNKFWKRINVDINITMIHIHEKIDCCKLEYFELKYPIGKKDDLNAFINPPKFK